MQSLVLELKNASLFISKSYDIIPMFPEPGELVLFSLFRQGDLGSGELRDPHKVTHLVFGGTSGQT